MNAVTIRQCAVLVGGLGTRLGALTADTPKPILPCGDRPFLAWLLRECARFGVEDFLLLTGHLSDRVAEAVETIRPTLPGRPNITLSREPIRAGTGGALAHARDLLDDRFLLLNGDTLFDFNLSNLLSDAADDGPDAVGRMVLRHLDDVSRFGVVACDGDRVTAFRERPAAGTSGGTINAGVYLFRRDLLEHLRPVCSLERDALPRLAEHGMLRATKGVGYFRDIGVPQDFAAAQTEVPHLLHRRALFLDRDGVINHDHHYVGTRERFEWMAGAREAIRHATASGWHVFVVTNQSGVARGRYTEADVIALHAWMTDEVRRARGTIDGIRFCPFHPQGSVPAYRRASDWRKPAPGMLLDLIRTWELDPARCVLIGDQPSDLAAAEAAGVAAHLFGGGDLAAFVAARLDALGESSS